LSESDVTLDGPSQVGPEQQALLERYVEAFERYDISSLVTLIREDAVFDMPPFPLWLNTVDDMAKWYVGPGAACQGSRLVPVFANGCAAFGAYKVSGPGTWDPFSIQVIEVDGDKLVGLRHFLDSSLFAEFGLPARLER
jgi:RNA polymerase sigma-70 factor (ECF subfamily)